MNPTLREWLELPQDGWYSRWDVAGRLLLVVLGAVLLVFVVGIAAVYVFTLEAVR